MNNSDLGTCDIARLCGVTIHTVKKWIDSGILPGYRLPGSRKFRRVSQETLKRFTLENGMLPLPDANAKRQDLGTSKIARLCKVQERTVRRWIESGLLPGYRLPGGKTPHRVTREALRQFVQANGLPFEIVEALTEG